MRIYIDGNCSPYLYLDSNNGKRTELKRKSILAWLAPRGIVTAAVASLFSIRLEQAGILGAGRLQGLVFYYIDDSGIQGLTAKPLANRLELAQKNIRLI